MLFGGTASSSTASSSEPDRAPAPSSASPLDRELDGDDYEPLDTELFSSEVALRETFAQRQADLADGLGLSREERIARHREFAGAVRDAQLDPVAVGAPLWEAVVDAQLAARRGTVPNPARRAAAAEDLRGELRARYGAERTEELEQAMVEFLAAHPTLRALLATEGLEMQGPAKQALLALADHVRQTRHI